MFLEAAQPFAISLLIGLAVGIERERRRAEHTIAMGVRTYTLVALLGTVAFMTKEPLLALGLTMALGALVACGYWRAAPGAGVGLTSEVAAALVFGLGYLAGREPAVAGVIGIVAVTILYSRARLHFFTREVLKPAEIGAALTLLVFAFVVLPFVDDQAVDPWGIVNPRKLGQIVAMIAAIEFGGYVVERLAGARIGKLATGFFGGLASSTAVFVGLPRQVKEDPRSLRVVLGAGLLACAATVSFYLVIVGSASPALAWRVAPAAVTAVVVSTALGVLAGRHAPAPAPASPAPASPPPAAATGPALAPSVRAPSGASSDPRKNPLDIKGAAKLGAFIFGFLVATAFAQRTLGTQAVDVVAFLGGLFELHGVSFASATLHDTGKLSEDQAAFALLLSLAASFVSKMAILAALDRGRLAAAGALTLTLVMAAAGAVQVAFETVR